MEKISKGHALSQSADIVKENLETLKKLFPTIVKEGKIDVEELKALLDEDIETNEEYYRFIWAGKNEARREANKPSTATLRPCKEESKNWETTGNIFIEGDNLEVLKLLQKSYAGKIKMMYFDPPYNKGKDFVYKDNYTDNLSNYLSLTGQTDEEGKKLSTNTESDGRYHSNWLNMMYPRLKLARNLLSDDGAIFISIDNIEVQNLRKLCDEIFGEENFIECITWNKRIPKNDKGIGNIHEYILLYVKNSEYKHEFYMQKDGLEDIYELLEKLKKQNTPLPDAENEIKKLYNKKGYDRGITLYNSLTEEYKLWGKINMSWPNADTFGPRYEVNHPILNKPVKIPIRGWRWKEETFNDAAKIVNGKYTDIKELHDGSYMCGKIWFDNNVTTQPSSITFLDEVNDFLLRSILSTKSDGGIEVEGLFEGKSFFSYPKPTSLIELLLSSKRLTENFTVLDIFAGSGTTAHSVFIQNLQNNSKNKFICIQLPEPTDDKTEAYKAGYHNIANLCKERIRRAGEKVLSDKNSNLFTSGSDNLDIGFKVFKLDSSNITAWDGSVANLEQNLFNSQHNIKTNRSEDDILYEVLLKYGLDLTVPIVEKNVNSCKIYCIGAGVLFVCLSDNITTQVADTIGKWKEELQPATCRALFKDNGFADDIAKTNSLQILRQYGIEEANSI